MVTAWSQFVDGLFCFIVTCSSVCSPVFQGSGPSTEALKAQTRHVGHRTHGDTSEPFQLLLSV